MQRSLALKGRTHVIPAAAGLGRRRAAPGIAVDAAGSALLPDLPCHGRQPGRQRMAVTTPHECVQAHGGPDSGLIRADAEGPGLLIAIHHNARDACGLRPLPESRDPGYAPQDQVRQSRQSHQ